MNTLKEICNLLDELNLELLRSSKGGAWTKIWTQQIKNRLITLGKSKGFYVCSSSTSEADWEEWLFDLSWLVMQQLGSYTIIKEFELVLESEWKNTDKNVLEDFQKLLLIHARYKILIIQDREDLLEIIQKSILSINKSIQGKYLIARYDNYSNSFKYTIF
jgi:hypothetical protein